MSRGWTAETQRKNSEFECIIRGYLGRKCRTVTKQELQKAAGVSNSAYYRHLKCPEQVTLGELRAYIKVLGISDEDILKIL